MKSLRFFFLFLTFALILSSCEKEDTEALAKNKALKEKVALEMKKMASNDTKKKTTKKTTSKKSAKNKEKTEKTDTKKSDPILANRPNQNTESKKDDATLENETEKEPVTKKIKAQPPVKVSSRQKKAITFRPAVIQIITNFDESDATVNGLPYPEYTPQGEEPGMVVPAGGPYNVEVKTGEKVKYYEVFLKANETRLLFVSSTGKSGSASRPKKFNKKEKKKESKKKKDKKDKVPGKVTIYGKPSGTIIVDGVDKGEKTPGTIKMKNGRHEIQVKYDESGEISEKKIVRVRSGSKIKLFFRERKK